MPKRACQLLQNTAGLSNDLHMNGSEVAMSEILGCTSQHHALIGPVMQYISALAAVDLRIVSADRGTKPEAAEWNESCE